MQVFLKKISKIMLDLGAQISVNRRVYRVMRRVIEKIEEKQREQHQNDFNRMSDAAILIAQIWCCNEGCIVTMLKEI